MEKSAFWTFHATRCTLKQIIIIISNYFGLIFEMQILLRQNFGYSETSKARRTTFKRILIHGKYIGSVFDEKRVSAYSVDRRVHAYTRSLKNWQVCNSSAHRSRLTLRMTK